MSEIQSISQGNYILQGTVATSAGIVGDGSTQNPLRADETVLWSGTANVGTVMELSEPIFNFKKIRLENVYGQEYYHNLGLNNGWWNPMTPTFHYAGTTSGTTSDIIFDRITFDPSVGDKLTFNSNMDIKTTTAGNFSVTNNVNNNTQRITKVIGINRINNA